MEVIAFGSLAKKVRALQQAATMSSWVSKMVRARLLRARTGV